MKPNAKVLFLNLIILVVFLGSALLVLLGKLRKTLFIKLILVVGFLGGLYLILLGMHKIAFRGEEVSMVDFLHFPLNTKDIIRAKAVHNIIDGIAGIALGIFVYVLFFHCPSWSWMHWELDTRSWKFVKPK